jgi:threonylcarbamoyladenosine tRNA methylthiotransferase MtaB
MSVEVLTLGCRLNLAESEAMRHQALAAGLKDVAILNTCAVTSEAVRQARQMIRRLKRENPQRRIIVTGCAAQIEPETFAAMPEVERVLGNDEKTKAAVWADLDAFGTEKILVNDIMSVRETVPHMIDTMKGWVRAFVQVQNGCDHRCTFCIIPYGRGNSRSVPMGAVTEQVHRLIENGAREIVLTGVDITSYGRDLPGKPTLGTLVRSLLKAVPDLPRLRLSSIDSVEADEDLWEAIATQPRLMPHLHLSLQAGDDLILKRMKRRHSFEDAVAFCARAHSLRPDIAFGADIIAGFPTETEAHFDRSLALIEACDIAYLHVFPFSARRGTPAAKMPPVPGEVIKTRAASLREAGSRALHRHRANMAGQKAVLLVEDPHLARMENFTPIFLEQAQEVGRFLEAHIRLNEHHPLGLTADFS